MGSKRGQRADGVASRGRSYAGMARARASDGRGRRRDLREDPGVRELRLPREPLAVVRLPRLRELVDQAALPGGVPRRAAATRSRWASTRRTRWSATPAATASRCCGPTWHVSGATAALERSGAERPAPTGLDACLADRPRARRVRAGHARPDAGAPRDPSYAVRLGLDSVRGIGKDVAERIVAARAERPFADQAGPVPPGRGSTPGSSRRWRPRGCSASLSV